MVAAARKKGRKGHTTVTLSLDGESSTMEINQTFAANVSNASALTGPQNGAHRSAGVLCTIQPLDDP